MKSIIDIFKEYSFLISIIYGVIGYLIGTVIPKISRSKIRKCLSLAKKDCKIILPSYEKELHNYEDTVSMCPIGDIKAASNVIDLIYATGLYSHQKSIIYESSYFDKFESYNIFCIGGSLANKYSYDLFQQFFPKFKIYATKEKIDNNPNGIPKSHFVESKTKRGFCWGNLSNEEFLNNDDERYAIIVKLSSEDFKIENHGTVHILFGNGIEGTLAISQYLLKNYEDLYKIVKKKKHYFIAFKIKKTTGIINPRSFVDLTDKMFIQSVN